MNAQSHGDEEFEYVDDQKNDTKINISQEDENFIREDNDSRHSENSHKTDEQIIKNEDSHHSELNSGRQDSDRNHARNDSPSRHDSDGGLDMELGQDLNMNGIDDAEEKRPSTKKSSKHNTNNGGFGGLELPGDDGDLKDPFAGGNSKDDDIFGGMSSNKKSKPQLNDPFGGDGDDLLASKPKKKDDPFNFGTDVLDDGKNEDDPFGFGGIDDKNDDPFGGGGGNKKGGGLNTDFLQNDDEDF